MALAQAPRPTSRRLRRTARGARAGMCLWLATAGGVAACDRPPPEATALPASISAPWPGPGGTHAWYEGPTTRYPHGVLGDTIEATRLHLHSGPGPAPCGDRTVTLPEELVFEDLAPRLADLDRDGAPEIIVVQSHQLHGAQLAIYRAAPDGTTLGLVAATPFIGQRNRWLAPVGAADLDGDGWVEIAYVDRPHLNRTLRVWRFSDDALTEIAALDGFSNHRIGEDFLTGGLRDCGDGPEIITADAAWTRVMATRLGDDSLHSRPLAPFTAAAIDAALACQL